MPRADWIARLCETHRYPHPVVSVTLVETHISWVLLTGERVYKVKKPVNLGFLDFSTRERRRHFCEEEVRLNRRFAPDLYLGVVPITGTPDDPRIDGAGAAFDFAVQMVQFDQDALLDRQIAVSALGPQEVFALGATLARLHQAEPPLPEGLPLGNAPGVWEPVAANFDALQPRLTGPQSSRLLARLRDWSGCEFQRLTPFIEARKRSGWVKECHGDLHLRNIARIDDRFVLFDCIEFDPALRTIDVQSELAFLLMDLDDHQRADLAGMALNGYLEHSGDYAGLALLDFYRVYRALVRAKVSALRADQEDAPQERQRFLTEAETYVQRAQSYLERERPWLAITHGLSGSGKSTLALGLAAAAGAIRIRSDVERKRLFAIAPEDHAAPASLYGAEASEQTFSRLEALAVSILAAGFPVIVDATFLKRSLRERFLAIATARGAPGLILSLQVDPQILRARLAQRHADVSDANVAILEAQLARQESLTPVERQQTLSVDAGQAFDVPGLLQRLRDRVSD